jgi:hypothetical protein
LPRPRLLLDVAIGGLVLVFYAVVQVVFLLGPHPFDPARYFATGINFPHVPADLWTLRIGLVVPVRVAVAVLGRTEAALYAVPLATGLLLAGAVYGTMLLLFRDRVVAAAGALVTVLNTHYLLNSSFIFPDTVATATLSAGFFFLVLGGPRAGERQLFVTMVATVVAGVLFGWSYLIREFSPVLLPAVIVAVFLLRYPLRRMALLAGAAVVTAGLELLYGLVRYGQPFIHLEALLSRGERPFKAAKAPRAEHIQEQLGNPLDALVVFPRLLLSWRFGWAVLLLLAIFIVAAVWLRDWRLWILAAWCFGFWAVMVIFGSWKLPSGRWVINVTNIRYWYPILPPLVMGSFGGVLLLMRRFLPTTRGTPVAQLVVVGLALLVLLPGFAEFDRCRGKDLWRNDPEARWDELRAWFATDEAEHFDVVFTDKSTSWILPAYVRKAFGGRVWTGRLKTYPHSPRTLFRGTDMNKTLILVNRDRFPAPQPNGDSPLEGLSREWSPVFIGEDGIMVVLAHVSSGLGDESNRTWLASQVRSLGEQNGCGQSPYEP